MESPLKNPLYTQQDDNPAAKKMLEQAMSLPPQQLGKEIDDIGQMVTRLLGVHRVVIVRERYVALLSIVFHIETLSLSQ